MALRSSPVRRCGRSSGAMPATPAMPLSTRLPGRTSTGNFRRSGYVESSPAIGSDSTVYIGSGDGKLYAISAAGSELWTCQTGSCIDCSPTIGPDGSVYIGSYDGSMYRVLPSGAVRWKYTTGGMVWSSPTLAPDGTVYFGGEDGRFYALNSNGTLKWKFTAGGEVWSSPALDPQGNVYFACGDGKLYALGSDGSLKWTYQTGTAADSSPAIDPSGVVYFGSGDGFFYAINPNGTLKWQAYLGQLVDSSAAISASGDVYVGTGGAGYAGSMCAFDPNGNLLWQLNLTGGVRSSPALSKDGNICFGTADGKVYVVNSAGNVLWCYNAGGSILSSPAIGTGGALIVGSDNGMVYCFMDHAPADTTAPLTPVVHADNAFVTPNMPLSAWWTSSDAESGIAGYSYAIGTSAGASDMVGWTNVGLATSVSRSDLVLVPGQSYYISVKATNNVSLVSAAGVSSPIVVTAPISAGRIGSVRNANTGTNVNMPGKIVTAVFSDCVFVEEPDRTAGIRCVITGTDIQPGAVVGVSGTVNQSYGETVLTNVAFDESAFTGNVEPFGMPMQALFKIGLNPIGLLVRVSGQVTQAGTGYFVICDGVNVQSNYGAKGVEVRTTTQSAVKAGDFVSVTGVVCHEVTNSMVATVVRAVPNTLTNW